MPQQKKASRTFLYFSATSINIVAILAGIPVTWSSSSIPKLTSPNPDVNPLPNPLSQYQISLTVSLFAVGIMIGPFFAGVMDKIGRKRTVLLASTGGAVSFLLTAFAKSVWVFYLARLLAGFVSAWVAIVVPNYITEISEKQNRGNLNCYMKVNLAFGMFFSYSIGPYLSLFHSSLVCLIPCILNVVLVGFFVPESPYFLVAKGEMEQAERALVTLRRREEVLEELKEIVSNVEKSFQVKINLFKLLGNLALLKALFIGLGLFFFQQLSGSNALLFYLQTTFEATGSQLSPEASAIVVGLIQFVSSILSPLLVDRLGRRFLLITSSIGTTSSIAILGAYFYLKSNNYETESIFWLPITCLMSFIMFFAVGWGPLPFTMLGEIFPPKFKAFACSLVIVGLALFMCLVTVAFPFLVEAAGMTASLWIFAGCGLVGLGFVYFCVPETTNKSLAEIQKILKIFDEN